MAAQHCIGLRLRYPVCWTYDLGTILPEGGVTNHERGRLEEGICRDGERGPSCWEHLENGSGNFE